MVLCIWACYVPFNDLMGQTPISSAVFDNNTDNLVATEYTATSPSDASGSISDNTSYRILYGRTQNQFITSYDVGGTTYDNFVLPDTLIIQRTDAGRQLIIFYEFSSVNTTPNPDEITLDPNRQNPEEGLYLSGLSNAGYDNILVNSATNFSNVERVDVIYYSGVVTSSPSTAVFPIVERGGNDDIKVAAIRGLDASGLPNDYYPTVVDVNDNGTSEWGNLGQAHTSLVLRRQDATSDPIPVVTLSSQDLHGCAISFSDFGIAANEIVYGYSIVANDVTVTGSDLVDFTNATNYPTNTGSSSGLDLIAGISTAVSSDNNLTRAKGPGGYKEALDTWLKANVGVTTATDASTVTDWQDQWLADNDAVTLSTAPLYRDGSSSGLEDINFNPTVDFVDNSIRGLQIANNPEFNTDGSGLTTYSTKSINIAFRTGTDITDRQVIFEQGSSTRGISVFITGGELYIGAYNTPSEGSGSNWAFTSTNTSGSALATETEYIVTLEYDGNSSAMGTMVGYLNGQSFGTAMNVGLLYDDTDGIGLGNQNSQALYNGGASTADPFDGSIPELIYCDNPGSFSSAQRNRIESYLALKYGITLDQSSPVNYVNSQGLTIFNTTDNASIGGYLEYNNDIAGIGRDDESEFLQTTSQSENENSLVRISRTGGTIGTDDTWLIWGNDAGSLTETATNTPDTIDFRLNRIWRVAEENSIGVTDVSFDITDLGFGTNPKAFSLLTASNSSSGNFSLATVTSGGTISTIDSRTFITFSNVDFTDGQYFTLGTDFNICSPGGVETNLLLWYKADEGTSTTTDNTTLATWSNRSESNLDATSDGNPPLYKQNTTDNVNFNAAIQFDGTNDRLNLGDLSDIKSGATNGGDYTLLAVGERQDDQVNYVLGSSGTTNDQELQFGYEANTTARLGHENNDLDLTGLNAFNSPAQTPFLLFGEYDGSTRIIEETRNGSYSRNTAANTTDISGSQTNFIGALSSDFYNGLINEVIVYSNDITDLEEQQIHSYLALKYGLTLTNNNDADGSTGDLISGSITEGDYVASNGSSIFWDFSDNTSYHNDVAGIGRDDGSCLNQKQSRSENNGSIVSMGLTEIATDNAANTNSFASDNAFLVWGNDAASALSGDVVAYTEGTITQRMSRIWKVDENVNTVGATDISFDLSGLGYTGTLSDYQLIISSAEALTSPTIVPAASFSSDVVTFQDIDLTDGQFFTLGTAREDCGPGGVTTDLALWLRADVEVFNTGSTAATDGQTVETWNDQSANSANAEDPDDRTTFETNTVNFNPAIQFNDDATSLEGMFTTSTNGLTQFTAAFFNSSSGSADALYEYNVGGTTVRSFFYNSRYGGTNNFSTNITEDAWSIWSVDHPFGSSANIFQNGASFQSSYTTNESDAAAGTYNYTLGDDETGGNAFTGFLGDVIAYEGTLTSTERQQVETYLAIKYGITIDQTSATNYLWSDGSTVIWNATTNASYNNDIAGIGRDDASCFSQKQSASVNTDAILTVGLGAVAADNASNVNTFTDDGDYLIWGNDNGATAQGSANEADLPGGIGQRMSRVWRVDDTGNVGATELRFNLNGLNWSTDASDFRLIVAGSGSGGTMSGGSLTSGATYDGDVLSFTGVDLADGEYFTIGVVETCGPGGVNTNIALWLRADLEVFSDAGSTAATNGSNALQWNDQGINGRNASEQNAGGGSVIEPVYNTNLINFNPALFITDANTTNNSYFRTAASTNTVSGDMTLMTVFSTTQNQGTANQIDNTPALIGAEDNTGSDDYGLGVFQGEVVFNAANTNDFTVRSTTTYNDNEPYIATGTRVQAASGAVELYVNSRNVDSGTSDATALDEPDRWAVGNQKDYDNEAQFQGNIAEVLVFSSVLTADERTRAESYLAIKYGITRDVTDGDDLGTGFDELDYRSANGTVVWDYSDRSAFSNDIFGIGRDDLSCLNQIQSKSENDDAIVDVQIASFPDDNSWFVSGNDNEDVNATGNLETPAGINSRLDREWQAQETGTVGTVSITYDLSNVTGTPTGDNNLNLVRLLISTDSDFSTGVTQVSPSSINSGSKTVTFEHDFISATGFFYTLGSEEVNALPVNLISFEASATESNSVVLNWATAGEINNSFFAIERSTDAINFETIGQVDGAGNTDDLINYRYTDTNPVAGVTYYRLKQVDTNGEFEHSEIKRVYLQALQEEITWKLYPNPLASGELLVLEHNGTANATPLSFQILGLDGRRVAHGQYEYRPQQIFIDTQGFPAGMYLLRITTALSEPKTLRFIIE